MNHQTLSSVILAAVTFALGAFIRAACGSSSSSPSSGSPLDFVKPAHAQAGCSQWQAMWFTPDNRGLRSGY